MSEVQQPARLPQKKWSLLIGIAMLAMLLLGAIVGLYLTKINQDLRQQASVLYPGEYCDSNGCDGRGECIVNKYHCDRNTDLGGGCQDTLVETSMGRVNFSANCGAEQIDVSCGGAPNTDFVSRIYPTACGEPVTPTPPRRNTPTPTPNRRTTPTPTPTRRLTPTPTPTGTLTPTPTPNRRATPTPTPGSGPQCHSIRMVDPNDGHPIVLTGNDDADFVPGETTVRFICSANQALSSSYHYKFRIFEPCGSANHTTPLVIDANRNGINYDIDLAGRYAVQCAVCRTGGQLNDCDWETYTPSTCN